MPISEMAGYEDNTESFVPERTLCYFNLVLLLVALEYGCKDEVLSLSGFSLFG